MLINNKYLTAISIFPDHAIVVNYAFYVTTAKYMAKIITKKGNVNLDKESLYSLL